MRERIVVSAGRSLAAKKAAHLGAGVAYGTVVPDVEGDPGAQTHQRDRLASGGNGASGGADRLGKARGRAQQQHGGEHAEQAARLGLGFIAWDLRFMMFAIVRVGRGSGPTRH